MWDFRPQEHSQIRNKMSGEEKRLTKTESQLLLLLLSNVHQVVTKTEIHNKIWRGKFVSDASITHAVASLRLALNDTAEEQCIIRTVPKVGYFVVDNKIDLVLMNQPSTYLKQPEKTKTFKLSKKFLMLISLIILNLLLFWFLFIPSQTAHQLSMSKVYSQTNTFTIKRNDYYSKLLLEKLVGQSELKNLDFYITSNKVRLYVSCARQKTSLITEQSVNFSIDIKRPIAKVTNEIVQKCQ